MTVVAGWVGALGMLGALAAVGAPGVVAAPGSPGAVGALGAAVPPRAVPVGRAAPGDGFVVVSEVDATIGQEMRYATSRNFTGAVVDGYDEPVCLLARPAAEALRRAQREALRGGYSLLVYDCYRPQRAVDRFVRWARDGADQRTKAEFYPEVAKERLIPEGYIAEKSGHSRGSTVDVTLTEVGRGPLDMGTPFDFFDPLAHTASPRVTGSARAHREVLGRLLGAQGFVNLPQEWWHFTYAPEAFPATYFDFPVSVASVHR
ncbi:M15 family metallopeptidase [Streptomyces sp. NBC_00335]|uniref:M15 family metallopeptidase n=1 Tax=unclassified Streptomyces TaxID=2593676 RepID=UPI0022520B22|nr:MULTISPECIES: M15 family metallopeptidase [unclassified Streptomyces]MCX5408623.1 M15 family metallopeptidase [Streptomyces sp. NBC_00086]